MTRNFVQSVVASFKSDSLKLWYLFCQGNRVFTSTLQTGASLLQKFCRTSDIQSCYLEWQNRHGISGRKSSNQLPRSCNKLRHFSPARPASVVICRRHGQAVIQPYVVGTRKSLCLPRLICFHFLALKRNKQLVLLAPAVIITVAQSRSRCI